MKKIFTKQKRTVIMIAAAVLFSVSAALSLLSSAWAEPEKENALSGNTKVGSVHAESLSTLMQSSPASSWEHMNDLEFVDWFLDENNTDTILTILKDADNEKNGILNERIRQILEIGQEAKEGNR